MAELGEAIVAFARDGRFPSQEECEINLAPEAFGPAIAALKAAKKSLEAEIHTINDETKDDVGSWVRNAKNLQEDVLRSKSMANEILRDSEDPGNTGRAVEEAEEKAKFLTLEVQYTQQLHSVLRSIKHVNGLLIEMERKRDASEMAEALRLLDESNEAIRQIPVNWLCRPKRLLEVRAHELKVAIHDALGLEWKDLVATDIDGNQLAIRQSIDGEKLSFQDAILGLKYFKEVDEYMEQLWHNLDAAIISPRLEVDQWSFSSVQVQGDTISLAGETDNSVAALLADLSKVFTFLHQSLPTDILNILCTRSMPNLVTKLIDTWLEPAVPPSVKQIEEFDDVIHHTKVFCEILSTNGFSGFDALIDWVGNAPAVWLAKCRETTLAAMRARLTQGTQFVKSIETIHREVIHPEPEPESEMEHEEATDGWDSAWIDDEPVQAQVAPAANEDDGADAWGWDDDGGAEEKEEENPKADEFDDAAEAWGWGDDDATQESAKTVPETTKPKTKATVSKEVKTKAAPVAKSAKPAPIEIVTKQSCAISSIPEAVLESVSSILEDGAAVTQFDDDNIVASAVTGIFAIPTLVLALFRGISPYYYAMEPSGNMYLYNDATYLAERLSDFTQTWKARQDLSSRAKTMLRLDNEVKSLQGFANRAYGKELNTQKTVVRDLMGGAYNVVQQGDGELNVEAAVERVQGVAAEWEPILAREFWCKSVGALIEAVASKVIADIMDLPSIGQEEGYEMARMIAKISELDRLFLPSRLEGRPAQGEEISKIASYVGSWLRMQFLSEVLQSNLNEVKYLWFESDLSLYFTADEVVDLIGLSFEMNARAKEVVREIRQQPVPRG